MAVILVLLAWCAGISGCLTIDHLPDLPYKVVSASEAQAEGSNGNDLPPVNGLHAETLGPRDIHLTWERPDNGSYLYEVQIDSPDESALPEDPQRGALLREEYTVRELEPETQYSFTVRTDNNESKGPTSDPVSNTTFPELWVSEYEPIVTVGDPDGSGYEIGLHRAPTQGTNVTVDLGWDKRDLNLTLPGGDRSIEHVHFNHTFWTTRVLVTASNGASPGGSEIVHSVNATIPGRDEAFDQAIQVSALVWIEPRPPEPVTRFHAEAVNSTTIHLEWTAPEDPYRTGYHVWAVPDTPPFFFWPMEPEPMSGEYGSPYVPMPMVPISDGDRARTTHVHVPDPQATETEVSGLLADTTYRFHIYSFTEHGESSSTRSTTAKTNQAPQLHVPGQITLREGEQETYTVDLIASPDSHRYSWTVDISSPNVSIDRKDIRFDRDTRSVPITIRADRDYKETGNQTIVITYQFDPTGSTNDSPEVWRTATEVTRIDNDKAAVKVEPGRLGIQEGSMKNFSVRPETKPMEGDIAIEIDTNEDPRFTVSPNRLVFNDENWADRQNVTVKAQPGASLSQAKGTILVRTGAGSSPEYSSIPGKSVPIYFIPSSSPDIQLHLQIYPEEPKAGETVEIHTKVINNSSLTFDGPQLVFYIEDHPIHNARLDHLPPGATSNVTHTLPVVMGEYEVRVALAGLAEDTTRLVVVAGGNGTTGPPGDYHVNENAIPGPGTLLWISIGVAAGAIAGRRNS